DLLLLRSELVPRFGAALAHLLTGGDELDAGAFGKRFHAVLGEHPVCDVQLLARVRAPVLAAQPFAVEEMCAGQRYVDARTAEAFDGLPMQLLRDRPVADQGARACLDAQRPIGPRRRGD